MCFIGLCGHKHHHKYECTIILMIYMSVFYE